MIPYLVFCSRRILQVVDCAVYDGLAFWGSFVNELVVDGALDLPQAVKVSISYNWWGGILPDKNKASNASNVIEVRCGKCCLSAHHRGRWPVQVEQAEFAGASQRSINVA